MKIGGVSMINTLQERAFANLSGQLPVQQAPDLFNKLASAPPPVKPPSHLGQHIDFKA